MNSSYRGFVAQGWILMFLILVCIVFLEFQSAVVDDRLDFYTTQEGTAAANVIVALMLVHAFVPVMVRSFDPRWFRWLVAALTATFGIVMIIHEILEMFILKTRPFGFTHLLDFAHHGLALWVSVVAIRWALSSRTPKSSNAEPSAV